MLRSLNKKTLRGDTLIEVMFAVGVFGIIAVSTISLMNRGVNTAQAALETTMARNEIDAQAEALRFIHDAYVSEQRGSTKEYTNLWNSITGLSLKAKVSEGGIYGNGSSIPDSVFLTKYPGSGESCGNIYKNGEVIRDGKSFAINTHSLAKDEVSTVANVVKKYNKADYENPTLSLIAPSTYPRLNFGNINLNTDEGASNIPHSIEGIWVTGVESDTIPVQYYDFYIRTCWESPGQGTPITISTTIRLYNQN